MGASEIDVANRRVVTYVNASESKSNITVTSLKLGPSEVTTYSPAIAKLKDFTNGAEVTVTSHGRSEKWMIFIEQTETVVELKGVDAWTGVAWIRATGIAGQANGFKYRKKGDSEWIDISGNKVTSNGGDFSAAIEDLTPLTTYECYAYSGDNQTEPRTFTTEEARQLPNASFETFSHDESDKYYSFYDPSSSNAELQTKWWGSGNKGSTTVGSSYSITNPDGEDFKDGNYSAKLESQYVIVKFAAGNIYVGSWGGIDSSIQATVYFGQPFEYNAKPKAIRFWAKWNCGTINREKSGVGKKGDPDLCKIFCCMTTDRHKVYSGDAKGTTFSPNDANIKSGDKRYDIVLYSAYFETTESQAEWRQIEVPFTFYGEDPNQVPTHLILTFTCSGYGDFFDGSEDSWMYIDDIELVY